MAGALDEKCRCLATELKLGPLESITAIEPLTGGVASDIARVDIGGRSICMKFALPKLRVAADWRAPVHRNAAEYAWLKTAATLQPDSALRLMGQSPTLHGFAMEFLSGDGIYLWKTALLNAAPERGEARQVGAVLGQIHAASTQVGFDTSAFQNRDDFRALRIEPYLSYTAQSHPDLADDLNGLADMLYNSAQVLVHGDVSPKNIILRAKGPVILDAECATMGDATFDPSFCLNHLVLKAVHLPGSRTSLLAQIGQFWDAYAEHVTWEPVAELEARVCTLLPALMLGRVDGKSPVEYLAEAEQKQVRVLATDLICKPTQTLTEFSKRLAQMLKEQAT